MRTAVLSFAELQDFPVREDFVQAEDSQRSEFLFLPTDVHERTDLNGYKIVMFGIQPSGRKTAVVITDVLPYYDVRVPDDQVPHEFAQHLFKDIQAQEFTEYAGEDYEKSRHVRIESYEIVQQREFIGYSIPCKWVRLRFKYMSHRKLSMEYCMMKYTVVNNVAIGKTNYVRQAARDAEITLTGWLCIDNVRPAQLDYINTRVVAASFVCNIGDISNREVSPDEHELFNDRSMMCGWDIEAVPAAGIGTFPSLYKIRDRAFMISLAFCWQDVELIRVCITDLPAPEIPGCIQIRCSTQQEVMLAWAHVLGAMAPEFIFGYNDGNFDTPYILERLKHYEILELCYSSMSAICSTDFGGITRWPGCQIREEKYKIDASFMFTLQILKFPGCIPMDVMAVYRKMFPKSDNFKLNTMLQHVGLETKTDMEINTMFKIYALCTRLRSKLRTQCWHKQNAWLHTAELSEIHEAVNRKRNDFYINNLSRAALIALHDQCKDVVDYCNIDALRCVQLMRARNVIVDRREIGRLCYLSCYDCLYRADGIKVQNLTMAYAKRPEWSIAVNAQARKTLDAKYGGAYVVPARKGGYKSGRKKPVSGLDFASLYPNIMSAFNISPELTITDRALAERVAREHELFHDQIVYDGEALDVWIVQSTHPMRKILQDELQRAKAQAGEHWPMELNQDIVQRAHASFAQTSLDQWHDYGMGLFPYVLQDLYQRRSKVKKSMALYDKAQELLDHARTQDNALAFLRAHAATPERDVLLENWENNLDEFLRLKFNYYNSKQLGIKLYMNTYYGQAGSANSPMFLLEVAALVTHLGQKATKSAIDYVQIRGFEVLYGDTDSIYISAPDTDMQAVWDERDTETRWTHMVQITMQSMNRIRNEVNNMLMMNTQTPFLRMAYEEVLWPFILLGKKKYVGIQHCDIINFAPCKCSLQDFMKSKLVFMRGIDIVRRNSSEYLKRIIYEILHEYFALAVHEDLQQVVERKIREYSQNDKITPDDVARNAQYKLPKPGKPGNTAVIGFVARINALADEHSFIERIEPGQKFKFVVVQRYPWQYSVRGNQREISIGDRYERLELIKNPEYQRLFPEPLQIDVDYYMRNEVLGKISRFLSCFEKYGAQPYTRDPVLYKKHDEAAVSLSKKILTKEYNENYARQPVNYGKRIKQNYKLACERVQAKYSADSTSVITAVCKIKPSNIVRELQKYLSRATTVSKYARMPSIRQQFRGPQFLANRSMNIMEFCQQILRVRNRVLDARRAQRDTYVAQLEKFAPQLRNIMHTLDHDLLQSLQQIDVDSSKHVIVPRRAQHVDVADIVQIQKLVNKIFMYNVLIYETEKQYAALRREITGR